jgi:transposase-like protein
MERREYTPEYKTKIVLEVLEGLKMANEIAAREGINPKLLSNWKSEFLQNAHRAFTTSKEERHCAKELKAAAEREQELMAKVGVLTMENDWLKKKSKEALGYEPTGRNGYK